MYNSYKTIIASFFIMLSIGGVYAWSTYVPYLQEIYSFSKTQTQFIFGSIFISLTGTMMLARSILEKFKPHHIVRLTGLLFMLGYLIAYLSKGEFWLMYIGIALVGGIATGLGYLFCISIPARWFPNKKGLVTGIASAGFGGGSVMQSLLAEKLFSLQFEVLSVFLIIGIFSAIVLFLFSFFVFRPEEFSVEKSTDLRNTFKSKAFIRLCIGIFTGTFAGLMIISNLKPIGIYQSVSPNALLWSVSVFSIANLSGRFFWGTLNDYISGKYLIPITISLIGISSFILIMFPVNSILFVMMTFIVGMSFGANFVIYAKETAQAFGVKAIGSIYPFVFLAYGISGLIAPIVSGVLFDKFGNYTLDAYIALVLCILVAISIIIIDNTKTKTPIQTT